MNFKASIILEQNFISIDEQKKNIFSNGKVWTLQSMREGVNKTKGTKITFSPITLPSFPP